MKRVARRLAALYPARWRRRYGDEFDALIEDSPPGWRVVVDVFKEALNMRIRALSLGALGLLLAGMIARSGGGSILLLVVMLASLSSVLAAVAFFFNGERRLAGRVFYRWSIGAAVYLAIVVVGAMLPRDAILRTGAPYCEDDWCMSFDRIDKTPTGAGVSYRLDVRLFSLANHGLRSAKGASVYLTDERNRRFPLVYDASAIPLDVALEPKEPVETSLTFDVPSDAKDLFFAGGMDHIRYASFMIGSPDLLRQPILKLRIQ